MTATDQFATAFKNYWVVITTVFGGTLGMAVFLVNASNDLRNDLRASLTQELAPIEQKLDTFGANQVQIKSDLRDVSTRIAFQNEAVTRNVDQLTNRVDDLEEYRDQILGSQPYELRNSSSE